MSELLWEQLLDVRDALEACGTNHFVFGGTLLGLVRDGGKRAVVVAVLVVDVEVDVVVAVFLFHGGTGVCVPAVAVAVLVVVVAVMMAAVFVYHGGGTGVVDTRRCSRNEPVRSGQ